MDARDRLRRYLEQRREMGETELVLDGMTVEDVLRLVGARSGGVAPADAPGQENIAHLDPSDSANPSSDWREILRGTGAAPDSSPSARPAATPPSAASPPPPAAFIAPPAGIVIGRPIHELPGGPMATVATIDDLARTIAACTRCPLYSSAKNPVPGEGNPNADLVCVGEAPGQTEDETGRPFVGDAGQLLTKILAAIDLKREDVFICNVLKHRPPLNRDPLPQEVTACSPYLVRQLELIRPRVILALGRFAAQTLLETKLSISKLRGSVHTYYGIPLIVTYHPAALLRDPAWKRPTWEDVQLARRILDRPSGA